MSLLMGTARTVLVAAGAVLGLIVATRLEPPTEIGFRAFVDIEAALPEAASADLPDDVTITRTETEAVVEAIGETADVAVSRALGAAYGLLLAQPTERARLDIPRPAPLAAPRPDPLAQPPRTDGADLAERLEAVRALEDATATLRRLGEDADPDDLAGTSGLPPAVESAAARWVEASIEAADAELIYGPRHPSRTAALLRMESAAARLLATAAAARADAEEARRLARERLDALDRRERATSRPPTVAEPAPASVSSDTTAAMAPAVDAAPLPLLAARVEPIRAATAIPYRPAGAAAGAILAFLSTGLAFRGARRASKPVPIVAEARSETPGPQPSPPSPAVSDAPAPAEPAPAFVSLDHVWERMAEALEEGERVRILVRADAVDARGDAAVERLVLTAIEARQRILIVDADADGLLLEAFGVPEADCAPWHLVDLAPSFEAHVICLPHLAERATGDAWRAEHARCMLRLVETTFDVVVIATAEEPDALTIARFADEGAVIGLTEIAPGTDLRAA